MATTEDLGATTRHDLWWAVPGALVGAIVMYVAHRGLIDDAYITLSYARNVAEHLHWGMIPTEESNTATSPLNVMLLALATWVGGVTGELRPVLGLGILTVALSAAMAVWAAQIARRLNVSGAWSLAVLAVVFANPFVNSAIGLEVVPIAAFLTGLTAQAVHGRRLAFGVLAGLLVLTRPDLAHRCRRHVSGDAGTAAPLLGRPGHRRSPWRCRGGSSAGTTSAPRYRPRLVIKTLQRSFGDATFANGLWKMWQAGSDAAAVARARPRRDRSAHRSVRWWRWGSVAGCRDEQWPLAALGLGGLADFGAYCLLGVPPYHWYYVSSTVALGVTGVFGLALLLDGLCRRGCRRPVTPLPSSWRWCSPSAPSASVRGLGVPWVAPGDLRQLGDPRAVHGHG